MQILALGGLAKMPRFSRDHSVSALGPGFLCLLLSFLMVGSLQARQLDWEQGTDVLRVRGLPPALTAYLRDLVPSAHFWRTFFPVYFNQEQPPQWGTQPPLLGDYCLEGDVLSFRPLYPFARGYAHTAQLRPAAIPAELGFPIDRAAKAWVFSFILEEKALQPAGSVAYLMPDQEVVPANMLKFYLYFDRPMTRRWSYRYIKLLDAEGNEIAHPFVHVEEGLWHPDGKRLTLILDPGRIKQGVGPNVEEGMVLQPGNDYRLVVSADMKDARGRVLAHPFTHSFRVGPVDRTCPDPSKWKLERGEDRQGPFVRVQTEEPLDAALAQRLIWLESAGQKVAGTYSYRETTWLFRPAGPLVSGPLVLAVDPRLEDLAGNSLNRPFDVDLEDGEWDRLPGPLYFSLPN